MLQQLQDSIPYQNRVLDSNRPVEVYRCLTKPDTVYSVRQNGLVVAHVSEIALYNVTFHVSKAGQERCRSTNKRNVHAWIIGTIEPVDSLSLTGTWFNVSYNPFKDDGFLCSENGTLVEAADFVLIDKDGVSAFIADYR